MSKNNLKIAVVLRLFSPSGGLELYALKLVEGLLENGHKITVICEKDDSGLTHPNLTVHRFSPAPEKLSKSQRLDYYLAATSKAVKDLGPFDIIHSHHFPVDPVDVVTFHNHTARRLSSVGYGWERTLNDLKMTFTKAYQARHEHDARLARGAKMRIFVGAVMKDDFYQNFSLPKDAPYAVAHPGARLTANSNLLNGDSQSGEITKDSRSFTFLFVGKGFRKKGLDTLLSSCIILKRRGHSFALQIAGIKASPAGQLQLQVLHLADQVKYLGFRQDMPYVYAGSQAIILPSKIEPFGMAPIQGMQFGLVPIVSRVCGVAEVLTDGQDCLILNNHLDKVALADLMERLIVDRELYKRLQGQAKVTADKLNWRQTVEATEKAYERVIEDKNGKHA
jgi:glycosyltransferase involved in cell wall biosynthesis